MQAENRKLTHCIETTYGMPGNDGSVCVDTAVSAKTHPLRAWRYELRNDRVGGTGQFCSAIYFRASTHPAFVFLLLSEKHGVNSESSLPCVRFRDSAR